MTYRVFRPLLVAVALSGSSLMVAPDVSDAAAYGDVTTDTLEYNGGAQQWKVPAGVNEVTIDAYGAEGGGGATCSASVGTSAGGFGGRSKATITVTPGEVLQVFVGGHPGGNAGGFNGGGKGGSSHGC